MFVNKKSQQMHKLMTVLAASLAFLSDFIAKSSGEDSQQHTQVHTDQLRESVKYTIVQYFSSQSN